MYPCLNTFFNSQYSLYVIYITFSLTPEPGEGGDRETHSIAFSAPNVCLEFRSLHPKGKPRPPLPSPPGVLHCSCQEIST